MIHGQDFIEYCILPLEITWRCPRMGLITPKSSILNQFHQIFQYKPSSEWGSEPHVWKPPHWSSALLEAVEPMSGKGLDPTHRHSVESGPKSYGPWPKGFCTFQRWWIYVYIYIYMYISYVYMYMYMYIYIYITYLYTSIPINFSTTCCI